MSRPPAKWNGSLDGPQGWDMSVPPFLAETAEEDSLCRPLPRLRASGQGICWPQATEQAGVAASFGAGKGAWAQQRQPNAQLPPLCAGSSLQLQRGQLAATSSLLMASLFACPLVFLHSALFCSLSLFMCITLCLILCLLLCSSSSFLASLSVYE